MAISDFGSLFEDIQVFWSLFFIDQIFFALRVCECEREREFAMCVLQ